MLSAQRHVRAFTSIDSFLMRATPWLFQSGGLKLDRADAFIDGLSGSGSLRPDIRSSLVVSGLRFR
jgi:hypothetical protein